jgi:CHAD domain-containing protein
MITATTWLDTLRARIAALENGGAEEDVHQLRVATRRLSTWLKLARMRVLRSDLRWLRAAGGAVRDVDVVLATTPPEPMAAWLHGERTRRLAALTEVLAAPRTAALCDALSHIAPIDEARARQALPRMASHILEAGDALQLAPNDIEVFHHLRRAVRGLRYALEWLEDKTGEFKQFQDLSGSAADLSVALLLLDAYPDAAELVEHRRRLEEEFSARRMEAVGAWPALRPVVEAVA